MADEKALRGKLAKHLGKLCLADFMLTEQTKRLPDGHWLQLATDVKLDMAEDRQGLSYEHLWLEVPEPVAVPSPNYGSLAFANVSRYKKADGQESYGLTITSYDADTPSQPTAIAFMRLTYECLRANQRCYETYDRLAKKQSARHISELSRFRQIATPANRAYIREQLPRFQRLISNMRQGKCFVSSLPFTLAKQIEMFSNIVDKGWQFLHIADKDQMYRATNVAKSSSARSAKQKGGFGK